MQIYHFGQRNVMIFGDWDYYDIRTIEMDNLSRMIRILGLLPLGYWNAGCLIMKTVGWAPKQKASALRGQRLCNPVKKTLYWTTILLL